MQLYSIKLYWNNIIKIALTNGESTGIRGISAEGNIAKKIDI